MIERAHRHRAAILGHFGLAVSRVVAPERHLGQCGVDIDDDRSNDPSRCRDSVGLSSFRYGVGAGRCDRRIG